MPDSYNKRFGSIDLDCNVGDSLIVVILIVVKHAIRLHRADVYNVMYVPLHINSNRIGDIQRIFSDLLLMVQIYSHEKLYLKTLLNLLQASYTIFIKRKKFTSKII